MCISKEMFEYGRAPPFYNRKLVTKYGDDDFPGVSTIGKHIVPIENRNGNANVKYKPAKTLKNAYGLLKSKHISIHRSRMDCGSLAKKSWLLWNKIRT
jgi:hypothetical protein